MGMMRQYELVDRVRSYNPNTDEDLLRGLDGLVPPTESADDED